MPKQQKIVDFKQIPGLPRYLCSRPSFFTCITIPTTNLHIYALKSYRKLVNFNQQHNHCKHISFVQSFVHSFDRSSLCFECLHPSHQALVTSRLSLAWRRMYQHLLQHPDETSPAVVTGLRLKFALPRT